jgi:hypothetical protein
MSNQSSDKTLIPSLIFLGILIIIFCISTFDFPQNKPAETPFPTINARTVDLKNRLLVSDDFVDYCCGDSYYVKLGNQHDGLPSQEFISHLSYGKYVHTFDDFGRSIRIFTYEIVAKNGISDYDPEGYVIIFIYANANEAKNIYGGGEELPSFDLANFHEGVSSLLCKRKIN